MSEGASVMGISRNSVLDLTLGILVVLSMQTVYVKIASPNPGPILAVAIVIIMLIRSPKKLDPKYILFGVAEMLLIALLVFCQVGIKGISATGQMLSIMALLISTIISATVYFSNTDNLHRLLEVISAVVTVEAGISLFFFVFGQSLHILAPTGAIAVDWGGITDYDNYYGIYFVRDSGSYGIWSYGRNSGIFTEAPQHAFMLLFAILIELFIKNKTSKSRVILLIITIFTSYSTTGMILSLIAIALRIMFSRTNSSRMIGIGLILPASIVAALFLVKQKAGFAEESLTVRSQNMAGALNAFQSNPMLGLGFKASEFQDISLGHTSMVSQVLADGGLLLFIFYFAPILLLLLVGIALGQSRVVSFTLIFGAAVYVTVITYTPFAVMATAGCYVQASSLYFKNTYLPYGCIKVRSPGSFGA